MFKGLRYTTEELESRLKFFAGVVLVSVFGGAMFTIIYSLVFRSSTRATLSLAPTCDFRCW